MSSITAIQETPGQPADTIVFTSGSKAVINTSAEKVFSIITDYKGYSQWNSWTPEFEFADNLPLHVGSDGTLFTRMEGSSSDLQIPLKIRQCSSANDIHVLAWRASNLPSWFAVAERVHVVTPGQISATCEVKQFESMSGWGACLKYVMRVPQQLAAANLRYIQELKAFVERGSSHSHEKSAIGQSDRYLTCQIESLYHRKRQSAVYCL